MLPVAQLTASAGPGLAPARMKKNANVSVDGAGCVANHEVQGEEPDRV